MHKTVWSVHMKVIYLTHTHLNSTCQILLHNTCTLRTGPRISKRQHELKHNNHFYTYCKAEPKVKNMIFFSHIAKIKNIVYERASTELFYITVWGTLNQYGLDCRSSNLGEMTEHSCVSCSDHKSLHSTGFSLVMTSVYFAWV